jgi:uncharacterized membrane protein YfcA
MDPGMAGGIAGAVIGVMGGVLGTYASVRNATRPRERALTNRLAALGWTWMAAMAGWLILMPRPWNQAAVLLNLPVLLAIPWGNRVLARARTEDEAEVR